MSHENNWKEKLRSAAEIADYVVNLSNYDVCREQIEDYFFNCHANLVWIDIRSLETQSSDHNLKDDDRQAVCDSLDTRTMPPLLIENGKIIDGHHRLRTLLQRDTLYHWAYEVEEIPEQNMRQGLKAKNARDDGTGIEL